MNKDWNLFGVLALGALIATGGAAGCAASDETNDPTTAEGTQGDAVTAAAAKLPKSASCTVDREYSDGPVKEAGVDHVTVTFTHSSNTSGTAVMKLLANGAVWKSVGPLPAKQYATDLVVGGRSCGENCVDIREGDDGIVYKPYKDEGALSLSDGSEARVTCTFQK